MTITQNASSVDNSSALTKSSQWDTHGYVCVTIVAMFVPFILLGNLMVIISVAKFKRLHIPTNYFLTSLAVADVLVAAALPFYALAELHHLDMGDSSLCIVVNRVLMTAGGVSVMTLAVNAYDRYTAIMNPLEYILIMKPRRIAVLVLICWIFSSFICWAPFVIGWYTSVPGEEEHHYNQLHKNARILFTGAIFVPSCILIVFFYWRMFLIARHHARAIAAVEHSVRRSLEARFVRKDTKYAKTIAVLIGVFLCCWLPFQICIVVDITHQVSSHRWLHNYLMLLAFLNSGVNPWVYAYKSVDFRSAYKNIFRLLCKQPAIPDERASSSVSSVSGPAATISRMRLNRVNSRVAASNMLRTLRREVGRTRVEYALDRRFSGPFRAGSTIGTLPDLLRVYAASPRHSSLVSSCTEEEPPSNINAD